MVGGNGEWRFAEDLKVLCIQAAKRQPPVPAPKVCVKPGAPPKLFVSRHPKYILSRCAPRTPKLAQAGEFLVEEIEAAAWPMLNAVGDVNPS